MGCVVTDGGAYIVAAGIADDSGAVKIVVPSFVRVIYAETVGLALDWAIGGITVDGPYWIGEFEKSYADAWGGLRISIM